LVPPPGIITAWLDAPGAMLPVSIEPSFCTRDKDILVELSDRLQLE